MAISGNVFGRENGSPWIHKLSRPTIPPRAKPGKACRQSVGILTRKGFTKSSVRTVKLSARVESCAMAAYELSGGWWANGLPVPRPPRPGACGELHNAPAAEKMKP